MVPPPKPETTSEETEVCETAYGPRGASMLARVGAGPRSYGLSAACAPGVESVVRPTTAATAAAVAARRRLRPGAWVVPVRGVECTASVLSVVGPGRGAVLPGPGRPGRHEPDDTASRASWLCHC